MMLDSKGGREGQNLGKSNYVICERSLSIALNWIDITHLGKEVSNSWP